jgi:hypothetical protein
MYDEYGTETIVDIMEFTMLKRYLGKESEFTIDETHEIFDMVLDNLIDEPDYGKILGDDSDLEGFTRNHILRAKYLYNSWSSSI